MADDRIDFTFTSTEEGSDGWEELNVEARNQEGETISSGRIQVNGDEVDLGNDDISDSVGQKRLLAALNDHLASRIGTTA